MYKTAPRYLSGVSVFYGDDISRRVITGDVAFFIGQSIKGPKVPVTLSTIDAAVQLYGKNSPILKALYEFWDGYIDSTKSQTLQLVSLRVGGINAILETPRGVTISTADSYTGIEDDFNVYIGATTIKAWDKNGQKVLDTANGINTGHLIVEGTLDSNTTVFGTDFDADPYDTQYTLKTLLTYPIVKNLASGKIAANTITDASGVYDADTDTTTLTLTNIADVSNVNPDGWIVVKTARAAVISYGIYNYNAVKINGTTGVFTIDGEVTLSDVVGTVITPFVSTFGLTVGDSELTTDPRIKYEMFRNALLEIEQYTPDYIVPAGISFDETDTFNKLVSLSTTLVEQPDSDATTLEVDGAANWLTSGDVTLFDGTFYNQLKYSSKAVNGANYTITLDLPVGLTIVSDATSATNTFTVYGSADQIVKLRNSGYLDIDTDIIKYTSVAIADGGLTATVTRDLTYPGGDVDIAISAGVDKIVGIIGSDYTGYQVTHTYTTSTSRELGIGYVKETDIGGGYEFEWSDTPAADYNLAHFGYLLANFCNEAAVGANTPLCGMNVDISAVAAANYSRASIVNWIGAFPSYINVPGTDDSVSGVLASGTGLLGNSVMAGSYTYNRSALSDSSIGQYADPGFGLLLTSEGFIDGALARDNFGNLVDLGKFMVVGAGLLTFTNGASLGSYIDSCGVYSLGMLAGLPKNQGLSFARIGQTSNTTVTVVVHRKYYNDLARMKYIVPTREKGLGWVINNGDSVARTDSQYKLISTTRMIKTIVEDKRSVLSSFIGKALNDYYYEAAKTKLADSFRADVAAGLINGYTFDLQIEQSATAIGKLYLKIAINPPFELTQVTIDTVIDRAVTNS